MSPHILAVHLDNFLFLLLLAVAGLFQLLAKAASKRREDQTTSTSPPRATPPAQRVARKPIARAASDSDQERVRKLLEALGHPAGAQPPPPPLPQRQSGRRRFVLRIPPLGSPLPPLVTHPPDLPPEIPVPAQTSAVPIELSKKSEFPPERTFEVHQSQIAPEPIAVVDVATADIARDLAPSAPARAAADVTTLLRSASGLRDAIIVREILGQPRGLRQFELP